MRTKKPSRYSDIRPGLQVTSLRYAGLGRSGVEYKEVTGRAVMLGPAGWVVNIGGPHGTPHVVSEDNFLYCGKQPAEESTCQDE